MKVMINQAVNKIRAAAILGVRPATISDPRWRRRVGLRATKVGGCLRFLESELNELLERGKEKFR